MNFGWVVVGRVRFRTLLVLMRLHRVSRGQRNLCIRLVQVVRPRLLVFTTLICGFVFPRRLCFWFGRVCLWFGRI